MCICIRYIYAAPYYLVYFEEDDTVCVVSASAMIEADGKAGLVLEVGGACHVKEKGKVYEGKIITYGEYYDFIHVVNLRIWFITVVTLFFQVTKSAY